MQQERRAEKISQPTDDFKEVYETVHALQKRVFGQAWPRDLSTAVEKYALYLHGEVTEMVNEVNSKYHKTPKEIDKEKLEKEIIDIFIYALATASVVFEDFDAMMQCLKEKVAYNNTRKDWEINKT